MRSLTAINRSASILLTLPLLMQLAEVLACPGFGGTGSAQVSPSFPYQGGQEKLERSQSVLYSTRSIIRPPLICANARGGTGVDSATSTTEIRPWTRGIAIGQVALGSPPWGSRPQSDHGVMQWRHGRPILVEALGGTAATRHHLSEVLPEGSVFC